MPLLGDAGIESHQCWDIYQFPVPGKINDYVYDEWRALAISGADYVIDGISLPFILYDKLRIGMLPKESQDLTFMHECVHHMFGHTFNTSVPYRDLEFQTICASMYLLTQYKGMEYAKAGIQGFVTKGFYDQDFVDYFKGCFVNSVDYPKNIPYNYDYLEEKKDN